MPLKVSAEVHIFFSHLHELGHVEIFISVHMSYEEILPLIGKSLLCYFFNDWSLSTKPLLCLLYSIAQPE